MQVAFVGLGAMGYPMAGHLSRQEHQVTVFNRTASKAQHWVGEYGGNQATTLPEAARDADLVFTCVGNDEDLRQVVLGTEGLLGGLRAGAVLVDHSTVSAELSRELAGILGQRGVSFVDAPVSGGQQGAQKGQLSIMCGADSDTFVRVEPVLKAYGKSIVHMGPVGAGQLTKMVNQICVAGVIQSLAEGIHFARHAGLDVEKAMHVIGQGAASSWQLLNRHHSMIAGEYNHGFAVDWMRKDLDICLNEAARNGASLPVAALVNTFYAQIQALGGGRWDTSSLLARLQELEEHQG